MHLSKGLALGFLSTSIAMSLPSVSTGNAAPTKLHFCRTWEPTEVEKKADGCRIYDLENNVCYNVTPWREGNSRNNVFVQPGRTCFTNSDKCASIAGGKGRGQPWDSVGPDKKKPGDPWQSKLDTFNLDVVNIYCTG